MFGRGPFKREKNKPKTKANMLRNIQFAVVPDSFGPVVDKRGPKADKAWDHLMIAVTTVILGKGPATVWEELPAVFGITLVQDLTKNVATLVNY